MMPDSDRWTRHPRGAGAEAQGSVDRFVGSEFDGGFPCLREGRSIDVGSEGVELGDSVGALREGGGHAVGVADGVGGAEERDGFSIPSRCHAGCRQSFQAFGEAAFVAEVSTDGDALGVQVDGPVVVAGLARKGGDIFRVDAVQRRSPILSSSGRACW